MVQIRQRQKLSYSFFESNKKSEEKSPQRGLCRQIRLVGVFPEEASDNRRNPRFRVAKDSASRYITVRNMLDKNYDVKDMINIILKLRK